ncbi:hypothetical protein PREVCOP_04220 [Segatella copri DSM 18205]|uniref:Uncharacterized protein n=1 Tax=Segatella copri DSM 18205 TaxID=537011 RepID=D1PAJ5_9BACT|nr:hypothetical protein PREVCOP_04220 [Segatella copri DSM 18205]
MQQRIGAFSCGKRTENTQKITTVFEISRKDYIEYETFRKVLSNSTKE